MKTADILMVIDLQNGVCMYDGHKSDDLDNVVTKINELIDQYVSENKPVLFVQHIDDFLKKGSTEWEILPDLNHEKGTYFVEKRHPNSFYQTDLKSILDKEKVKSIEICGAETQFCVDSTIKFAHGLGYDLIMHKGLHTSWDSNQMSAPDLKKFYENIWEGNFVTFV